MVVVDIVVSKHQTRFEQSERFGAVQHLARQEQRLPALRVREASDFDPIDFGRPRAGQSLEGFAELRLY